MIVVFCLIAVILDLTRMETLNQTKVFDSDYYDLSMDLLPIENETTTLTLFLVGLVVAFSSYEVNNSSEFKKSLPFSMIIFWLQFFLMFIDSQIRLCIK